MKRLFMCERTRFRKKGQCILEQRSQRHGRTYSERHAALVLSGTQTSRATRGCKAAAGSTCIVIHTVTDARIMSTHTYAEIPRLATKRDQPIPLTACNGRNGRHTSTTPMLRVLDLSRLVSIIADFISNADFVRTLIPKKPCCIIA